MRQIYFFYWRLVKIGGNHRIVAHVEENSNSHIPLKFHEAPEG